MRRLREHPLLLVAALAAVAWALFHDSLPEIDLEELLQDLARELGDWTYLLVGAMAFLETGAFVGLIAPGEFSVILGGAVAGQGEISVQAMLGIVWFCAWAGDSVSFLVGARLGRGFLERHGPRFRITEERLRQVERYFRDHGGKTILVGRFIGLVRAVAPFIAGSSRMRYRAFVPYSILGTGIWSTTFVLLGYFFAQSLDTVARVAGTGTVLFGIVVGLVVAVVVSVRWLRVEANRERLVAFCEGTPGLRLVPPFVRSRQARFLGSRLTPGRLGLELTTVVSVLSVSVYVLVLYADLLGGDLGPTPGDAVAFDLGGDIRAAWLTDVVTAVTQLGAAYVAWPLAGAVGLWLVSRRRWLELGVLAIGLGLTIAGVGLLKEAIDRPRPGGALVGVEGDSFPSGHAAYSALYMVFAVTVARVAPGLVARFTLVGVGLGIAAAVGLSRVYLRAHYLSDVLGGWALGATAFGVCAAIALVIAHLRQNAPDAR